jgi:hypothetical protein
MHALGREYPATPQFYDLLVRLKSDAVAATHVDVAIVVASYLGRLASTFTAVHAASAAFAGRHLPVRDLLLKLATSWKAPLVTGLCATLLSVGYTVLSLSLIAVPALNTTAAGDDPPRRLAVFVAVSVAAAARFLYIYLAMVWKVGVVVSVLEDGCHGGLDALYRAGEVVKGRRATPSTALEEAAGGGGARSRVLPSSCSGCSRPWRTPCYTTSARGDMATAHRGRCRASKRWTMITVQLLTVRYESGEDSLHASIFASRVAKGYGVCVCARLRACVQNQLQFCFYTSIASMIEGTRN